MTYRETSGDIIEFCRGNDMKLVHGCNCFNTMGSGLAYQIKTLYKGAYLADLQTKKGDITKLSNFTLFKTPDNFTIINLYTQYTYGKDSYIRLDYQALMLGLRKLNYIYKHQHLVLPKIGCGNAGGDWDTVKRIIQQELTKCKTTICMLA